MGPCRNLFCKLTDSVFCSGDYDDDDDDDGSPVALFVLSLLLLDKDPAR